MKNDEEEYQTMKTLDILAKKYHLKDKEHFLYSNNYYKIMIEK